MSKWREMLKEAKELLDDGFINEQDYEKMKQEALALRSQSTNPGSTTPPLARPPRQDTLMGDTLMGSTSFGNTGMGSTGGGFGNTGGDTLAGVTQFQAVGQTIGSYKVLGELGQGGMGTVYRARHSVEAFAQQTGDVVIKLMNPQFAQDPTFRQRFITEAATGRSIQHPNVVRIHDVIFEEYKNVLAIVMDLVEGRPLENIIPSGGMPMEQALPIITQLSEALDHIHEMGIIHRDLKPENIIVSPSGKPVILDMGIAKNTDNNVNMTRTNSAMGTPLYMAPEQVDAKNVTSAADRYAFGLIVYRMLSGQLPWDSGSGLGMITAYKMMGNLNPLKDVANVSDAVSDAVMALLRTQAVDRTLNCSGFCASLLNPQWSPQEIDVVFIGLADARSKIKVIKEIRNIMSLNLAPAKDFVENPPRVIKSAVRPEVAADIKAKLEAVGAVVRIEHKGHSTENTPEPPHQSPKPLDVVEGSGSGKQEMVWIPKGDFVMGALENDDDDAWDGEKPRHRVTLTRDFFVGKYPVTQALWESVMGENPSIFKGTNRPVEMVSWFDVVDFCNKLSKREGLTPAYTINGEDVTCNWTANGYRLPTEAEWEYSARANQSYKYSGSDNVDEVAWYSGNSGKETHPVGLKKPNGFGLYDMSGNVYELVWDIYGDYSSGSETDPMGPDSGSYRVARGGGWRNGARLARVSLRLRNDPGDRLGNMGFRLSRFVQ